MDKIESQIFGLVALTAITIFFIPLPFFIIIACFTIIYMGIKLHSHFKEVEGRKLSLWDFIYIILPFVLSFIVSNKFSLYFRFLSMFFCVRLSIYLIVMYTKGHQFNLIEAKPMNMYHTNSQNEESVIYVQPENLTNVSIVESIKELIDPMIDRLPNEINDVEINRFKTQQEIGKMIIETIRQSKEKELKNDCNIEQINYKEIIQKSVNNVMEKKLKEIMADNITRENINSANIDKQLRKLKEDFKITMKEVSEEAAIKAAEFAVNQCKKNKISFSNNKDLSNSEIRDAFINAIRTAEKELNIYVPWISFKVVNKDLKKDFEDALKRNVTIKILYGIEDNWNSSYKRTDKTEMVASELANLYEKYGSLFRMKRTNSHAKLLLCDNVFYIIGGYNFLSFDGDYRKENTRGELSEYSEDLEQLTTYRQKYFDF